MNQQIKTSLGVIIILIIAITAGVFIWKVEKISNSAKIDRVVSCTDSDGGKNIYLKGESITRENGRILDITSDSCAIKDGNAQTQYAQGLDLCSGDNCYIYEAFCKNYQNSQIDAGEYIKCPNGCKDGACIESQPAQIDATTNWQTYKNDKYGFEFKYPKDYSVIKLGGMTGFEEWNVKRENQSVIDLKLTNWKEYNIEENTPGTFYQKIDFDNWKYFADNFNSIRSGNCNADVIKHIPGPTIGDLPRTCIINKDNSSYIKVETENNILFYTKDAEIYLSFSSGNDEQMNQILSTFKFTK